MHNRFGLFALSLAVVCLMCGCNSGSPERHAIAYADALAARDSRQLAVLGSVDSTRTNAAAGAVERALGGQVGKVETGHVSSIGGYYEVPTVLFSEDGRSVSLLLIVQDSGLVTEIQDIDGKDF